MTWQWPWVSRRAYVDAIARAQRAEAQLAMWVHRALDRTLPPLRAPVEASASEGTPTRTTVMSEIPQEIRDALETEFEAVQDPAVRTHVTRWALNAIRRGMPTKEIVAEIERGDELP